MRGGEHPESRALPLPEDPTKVLRGVGIVNDRPLRFSVVGAEFGSNVLGFDTLRIRERVGVRPWVDARGDRRHPPHQRGAGRTCRSTWDR